MRLPRLILRNPLRSLYAKIFLWFCATVALTLLIVLAVASVTESQPFGRRWMAVTQDLYAHTAVDFYRSAGASSLTRYLDAIEKSSGIHGRLVALADPSRDVLGSALSPETATVLAESRRTGQSTFRLGRVWTAASPASADGVSYIFLMTVYPERNFAAGAPISSTFGGALLPRVLLGTLLVSLFCLLLARHITRPIRILEDAATQLAAGSLGIRAGPQIAGRRDELARMALAFDRMAERIQGLIFAQQEMLGHISHELRSPLTRIGVSLELIRRSEPGPADDEEVDRIQLDLDRLNRMIGEILQITRMDLQSQDTRQSVSAETVDLAAILASIAQDAAFEARLMQKQVVFENRCAEGALVAGEENLLRSCCENVVRNALLYTPGETTIRIRLSCDATSATVVVEDEGPGVPPEALLRLFDLFYRAGAAQQSHPEGTGFGLAISHRIVTLHGGTITARNRSPHGLEIRITLPFLLATRPDLPRKSYALCHEVSASRAIVATGVSEYTGTHLKE